MRKTRGHKFNAFVSFLLWQLCLFALPLSSGINAQHLLSACDLFFTWKKSHLFTCGSARLIFYDWHSLWSKKGSYLSSTDTVYRLKHALSRMFVFTFTEPCFWTCFHPVWFRERQDARAPKGIILGLSLQFKYDLDLHLHIYTPMSRDIDPPKTLISRTGHY